MSGKQEYYVTMGAELGDPTSAAILTPHLNELTKLLDEHCSRTYCPQLEVMALTLRVGGEIWGIDFVGCKNMRLSKKKKYIALEIGMPPEKWRNKTDAELRTFITIHFSEALDMIIEKVMKENWEINTKELKNDFNTVSSIFNENLSFRVPGSVTILEQFITVNKTVKLKLETLISQPLVCIENKLLCIDRIV